MNHMVFLSSPLSSRFHVLYSLDFSFYVLSMTRNFNRKRTKDFQRLSLYRQKITFEVENLLKKKNSSIFLFD